MKHWTLFGSVEAERGNRVRDYVFTPGRDITEEETPVIDYGDGNPLPLKPGMVIGLVIWSAFGQVGDN